MPRMVVIRTRAVRYPGGPEGKEYKLGDEFDVATDVEAKKLTVYGAAKLVEEKKKGRSPASKVEPVEPPVTTAQAEPVVEEPDKYKTRVMRPRGIT